MPLSWEDSGEVDSEEIRAWLRIMSDRDLERTGLAAAYLVTPEATQDQARCQVFAVRLEESRAEWRRWNP